MYFPRWALSVDGDKVNEFESKFDAVEAAAEELDLTHEQMVELMAEGWLPRGQRGSVVVCDENESNY